MDILLNRAATEYAEYLLDNDEDHNVVKEILNKHMIVGDVTTLVGFSNLEEEDNDDKILYNEFMDAHGLLCEMEEDRQKLTFPKFTHIGIGFAWNRAQVKVVEFLTDKPLMINQLSESEDGGVEIRGAMLYIPPADQKENLIVGLYAARIASIKNMKKDIKVVGPQNIQMDKNTRSFIINIDGPLENVFYSDDPKVLEIYIRRSKQEVQYGVASNERINVAHLELCVRLPMELIPDPRTVIEDA